VLDIGLTVGRCRGQIEAVGRGQERGEIVVDLGAPAALFLMRIMLARTLAGLDLLHRRRKGDVAGIDLSV
jgi:hypothetical protein